MRRFALLGAATWCGVVFCTLSLPANAQPTPEPETAKEGSIAPPRVLRFVEAPAPIPTAETVAVLFEVTVDASGRPADPKVVESAGAAFDHAATVALMQFLFAPARRGDSPIAVRIRYRYEFRAATEPPPSTEQDSESDERRRLHELGADSAEHGPAGAPAPRHDGEERTIATTERRPQPKLDTASNSPISAENPSVEPDPDEEYGAVAQITAPPREVTRRVLQQQDLTTIPGTSGDALRAIEIMPGVARTGLTSGDPILRGAAWHESRSYIEGVTVPLLFHFGGVKSAFNSRLLSRVELYPGNYGVGFGRSVGGVVEGKVRDPKSDRLHATAEASVIDSTVLLEAPLGRDASFAVAGRRSNIDFLYESVAPKSTFSVVAAPVYYDYQGLGSIRLARRHQLRLLSFGSQDSMRLLFANPSDFDPALRDEVDVSIGYHRVQARLDSELSADVSQRLQLTYGHTRMRQHLGTTRAEMAQHEVFSRGEWTWRLAEGLRTNLGYDVELLSISGYYIGARPPQAEGEVMNGGMSTEAVVDVSNLDRIDALRPAGYAEFEWHPILPLSIVTGLRVDHYSDQGAWTVNPRLATRYEVFRHWTVKWGIGRYSQNPQYYELIRDFGNPNLRPYHAVHYALGLEHSPTSSLRWGVEGFYKRLTNRVVSTPGGQPPAFLNDGVGRIYGAELFAQYTDTWLRAWLAYTLSRSERQDRTEPWRLFEKDQTHVLAVTTNLLLGRGWELGGRFRFTSGNPYTPVLASIYDAGLDVYRPVNARPFSARNPWFHQLDVRVEKTWRVEPCQIALYLDIQNLYGAKNYEGFDYSYDFRQRQRISGLPLIPNLGLRGEI